jgi:hypothetical protein
MHCITPEDISMRTLSVRLDDQTDSLLRAFCARTGQTQSDAVKAGIAALAAQAESPAKLAEDLELVGCFDSGVGDLGRNHSQRLREKLAGKARRG